MHSSGEKETNKNHNKTNNHLLGAFALPLRSTSDEMHRETENSIEQWCEPRLGLHVPVVATVNDVIYYYLSSYHIVSHSDRQNNIRRKALAALQPKLLNPDHKSTCSVRSIEENWMMTAS